MNVSVFLWCILTLQVVLCASGIWIMLQIRKSLKSTMTKCEEELATIRDAALSRAR